MVKTNFLLKLFRRDFIIKFLLLTLLYMLVPLTEIFIIMIMGNYFGQFFLLGLTATTGLAGIFIVLLQANKTLIFLKEKINNGEYPDREFTILAGILVSTFLFITPGFITDLFGFLFLIPFFRNETGKFICLKFKKTLHEMYEYLRLYGI